MSPSPGVWVASRRGELVGTVERRSGEYHATNARGRALGAFEDLDSACDAIARTQRRPAASRTDTVVKAVLWGVIGGGAAVALLLVVALFRMGG